MHWETYETGPLYCDQIDFRYIAVWTNVIHATQQKHMKLITKFWLRIIRRYRQIIWHYTAIWIGTIKRQWIYTRKCNQFQFHKKHCGDIMMSAMASQIIGVSIVCFNRLLRRRSKKTSKLRITGPREGNPPVTDGLPPRRGSNAEKMLDDVIMHSVIKQK